MTEFTAIVFALAVLMFFLLHLSFNLSENYDVLKVLLILTSLSLGSLLAHVAKLISVDQGASANIQSALDVGFYVWVVLVSIVTTYFVIYFIVRAWNKISKKENKIDMSDEENS